MTPSRVAAVLVCALIPAILATASIAEPVRWAPGDWIPDLPNAPSKDATTVVKGYRPGGASTTNAVRFTEDPAGGIEDEAIEPDVDVELEAHKKRRGRIDYLIVTERKLASAFLKFAKWKRHSGTIAEVRTVSSLRLDDPNAADDAERVRNLIRDAHGRGARWVLLGGDTEIIPARLAYSHSRVLFPHHIPSDRYFACLDGSWNADGDEFYGEGSTPTESGDDADLVPEVHVGRAPVRTAREARAFVEKTISYARRAKPEFRDDVLFLAEILFPFEFNYDGARFTEPLLPKFLGAGADVTRRYEGYMDPRHAPGSLPGSLATFLEELNRGYNITIYVGKGSPTQMQIGEEFIEFPHVMQLENRDRLTNLYSLTSLTHDITEDAVAEAFLRNPRGGAVTSFGPSSLELAGTPEPFLREYFRVLIEEKVTQVGAIVDRHFEAFLPGTEADGLRRDHILSMILLGDPQVDLGWPSSGSLAGDAESGAIAGGQAVAVAASHASAQNPSARPEADVALSRRTVLAREGETVLAWARTQADTGPVQLFDLSGRKVRSLRPIVSGDRIEARWDRRDEAGSRVGAGVYFARAGTNARVLRVVVLQ